MNSPNRIYPEGYKVPRKNVLLISCIDLRLLDDVMHFMHHDNLTNRFDQFVLAGAALTCGAADFADEFDKDVLNNNGHFKHWKQLLFDHIQLAITLHKIGDIYIIEHQDCGAYENFLKGGSFDSEREEQIRHKQFAVNLSKSIHAHNEAFRKLHIHCFMIDIRGDVTMLDTTNPQEKNEDLQITA